MREHEYEGTTATAVLLWTGAGGARYLQAANVGDSRAYLVRDSGVVRLTKDHKLSEEDEKARMANCGVTITDGQVRFQSHAHYSQACTNPWCAIAIARALGARTHTLVAPSGHWYCCRRAQRARVTVQAIAARAAPQAHSITPQPPPYTRLT